MIIIIFFSTCQKTEWLYEHTRISGKVEDEASEEGEEHTGDDDVDDEVQRQPQHEEVVGDVQVRGVWAAGIVHPVLPSAEILHHPLSTLHEVTQIRAIAVLVGTRVRVSKNRVSGFLSDANKVLTFIHW